MANANTNHKIASPAVIQVNNLNAHYGKVQILKNINLCLEQGNILVIMGGSGSGKSTLMKHLLALKKPSSGQVLIEGSDINKINAKALAKQRMRMGVAFQGGALLSSLTVGENIKLPLHHHHKLDAKTIDIMTRLKLDLMNLGGAEHLMPSQLSGGMLKRAGLARAVIQDPKLLFFDEPSAGLDPVTSVELDQLILKLRSAMSMSIVVVTHDLDSAFTIADKITILNEGEIIITGTVDEIKQCADERVQNLIHRKARNNQVDGDKFLKHLTTGMQ